MPPRSIRYKIGHWACKKSFAYYNANAKRYAGLPRYLEILVNWGFKGESIRNSFRYRWVKR